MKSKPGLPRNVRLSEGLGRSATLMARIYDLQQLSDDVIHASGGGYGDAVCEHWRVDSYSGLVDSVPDWENHFDARRFARNETIQFELRPVLLEESLAEHDDSEP